jgi:hypothetical protein
MKRLSQISLVLLGLALALPGGAAEPGTPAGAAPNLGGLESLVGQWTTTTPEGGTARATYELASAGSALVEKMDMGDGGSMVTVYHRDGDGLMLTHYCALQNQPRMRAQGSDGKVFHFAYVDATNLAAADAPHMHSLKVTLVDHDHFQQEWTFHQGGQQQVHSFRYERAK